MTVYAVWAEIRSKLYLGEYEAKSQALAAEQAAACKAGWPGFVYAEDHEVVDYSAEEK